MFVAGPEGLAVFTEEDSQTTPTKRIKPIAAKAERRRVELRFLDFMIHSAADCPFASAASKTI
jgi:hypothetical protein